MVYTSILEDRLKGNPSLMATKSAPGSSGVVSARSKQTLILAPGQMGFSNLIEPDDAFDSLKFNVQTHHTPEQIERLIALIDRHAVEAMWVPFLKAANDAEKVEPKGGWQRPDAETWVQDHLKAPAERSPIQLPSIQWANEAEFRSKKTGEMQRKVMKAWDAQSNMLDLPSLHLGRGSIIQPVVMPGMFISPIVKQPQLSFKLQGIRVLQLVQYGAGGAGLGDVDEADMALLGEGVELADLSAFTRKAPISPPSDAGPSRPKSPASNYADDDDEIPF